MSEKCRVDLRCPNFDIESMMKTLSRFVVLSYFKKRKRKNNLCFWSFSHLKILTSLLLLLTSERKKEKEEGKKKIIKKEKKKKKERKKFFFLRIPKKDGPKIT